MRRSASLVMVGDELLAGGRADGNGPWLLRRLRELGVRAVGLEIVGDAADAIRDAVRRAAARADVVLVGGGLGPTDDDGTRAGLAAAAGVGLVEDPAALEAVRAAQRARGYELDARRRREALLPRGARALRNPEGTAPGVHLRVGEADVYAMPGVPREIRAMAENEVFPALVRAEDGAAPAQATFHVAGVREPDVAEALAGLPGDVALGLYPHEGELEIRIGAEGEDGPVRVTRAAEEARRRLGPAVYDEGPIERHVVSVLRARSLSVTTAESMTGGLVARMLTAVPGASDVFAGGWVTYSDAWKHDALGVPGALLERHGAVSREVAVAMAEGARQRAGVDTALAVTGVAGPGDGEGPDGPIPQGTAWVALAFAGRPTEVVLHHAPMGRQAAQRRAAVSALDLLRRALASA